MFGAGLSAIAPIPGTARPSPASAERCGPEYYYHQINGVPEARYPFTRGTAVPKKQKTNQMPAARHPFHPSKRSHPIVSKRQWFWSTRILNRLPPIVQSTPPNDAHHITRPKITHSFSQINISNIIPKIQNFHILPKHKNPTPKVVGLMFLFQYKSNSDRPGSPGFGQAASLTGIFRSKL